MKKTSEKIKLTLSPPPTGLSSEYVFADKAHFDAFLEANSDKFANLTISGTNMRFGTLGQITNKIQLQLTNPPSGMHNIQTFDDKKHLDAWLKENKELLPNLERDDTKLFFGSTGTITTIKPDEK